jgi:glyoxylase-like metal-dependent hydrolase (beta-lactamase superfamily II)
MNHFKINRIKNYIYVIKENISLLYDVYTNDPLNIYLILGSQKALLLDTGCGLFPLKSKIKQLIGDRDLLVFNSHYHWDHPLGNYEFDEVYIHEAEVPFISKPYDVSFFKDSPKELVNIYAKRNYLIPQAKKVNALNDEDEFSLGNLEVKVIHCPGHSPGSICIITSNGELFIGDVAYYGDQFLPKREELPIVLKSLSKLIDLCKKQDITELYPSHRISPCDRTLLTDLYEGIKNIENLWDTKKPHNFFNAWQIDDNKFRYFIAKH